MRYMVSMASRAAKHGRPQLAQGALREARQVEGDVMQRRYRDKSSCSALGQNGTEAMKDIRHTMVRSFLGMRCRSRVMRI